MDEYIDVKLDVFEHVGQRVRLRMTMTVSALIEEILKEFDDITADSPENYSIYLKGSEQPLKPGLTFQQLDIQPQDELIFDYAHRTMRIRKMIEIQQRVFLREETTGKTYDIEWQPAVIGRPTNEVDHNIILAVNVQFLPNGKTISRKHAQITFSEGRYYIEALVENNPVFLNGKEIPANVRREIKSGDRLLLGNDRLAMVFKIERQMRPAENLPANQPEAQKSIDKPLPEPTPQPADESVSQKEAAASPSEGKKRYALGEPQEAYFFIEKASQAQNLGQRLQLSNYPFIIGRDLPSLTGEADVSRKHVEVNFDLRAQKFYVTDLASTNGTTVDGNKIAPNQPREIYQGTRIGLGQNVILRLEV